MAGSGFEADFLRGSRSSCVPSFIDRGLPSHDLLETASEETGVPGLGAEMNSLYELSVMRGAFQGNRRSDMQAKMIARDHISVG